MSNILIMRTICSYTAFVLLLLAGACTSSPTASAPTEDALPPVDEDQLILRLSADLVAEPQTQAEQDRNAIINYAIDNVLDVQSTSSQLYYWVLKEGKGEFVKWGDRIQANYKGYFLNGKVFDSTTGRNPLEFYVGNMIDGWNEGLEKVKPGGKILLLIPSHLGYGEEGLKDGKGKVIVPPNEVLVFEIEVLE